MVLWINLFMYGTLGSVLFENVAMFVGSVMSSDQRAVSPGTYSQTWTTARVYVGVAEEHASV